MSATHGLTWPHSKSSVPWPSDVGFSIVVNRSRTPPDGSFLTVENLSGVTLHAFYGYVRGQGIDTWRPLKTIYVQPPSKAYEGLPTVTDISLDRSFYKIAVPADTGLFLKPYTFYFVPLVEFEEYGITNPTGDNPVLELCYSYRRADGTIFPETHVHCALCIWNPGCEEAGAG